MATRNAAQQGAGDDGVPAQIVPGGVTTMDDMVDLLSDDNAGLIVPEQLGDEPDGEILTKEQLDAAEIAGGGTGEAPVGGKKKPATEEEPGDEDLSEEEQLAAAAAEETEEEETETSEEETDSEEEAPSEPETIVVRGVEYELDGDLPEPVLDMVKSLQALETDLSADHTQVKADLQANAANAAKALRLQEDIEYEQQTLEAFQQLEAFYLNASGITPPEVLGRLAASTDTLAEYEQRRQQNDAITERQKAVASAIQQSKARLDQQRTQAEATQKEQAAAFQAAELRKLSALGITEKSIESIFDEAAKNFGVTPEHFHGKCDSVFVQAIADANKYRALQRKVKSTKVPNKKVVIRKTTKGKGKEAGTRATGRAAAALSGNPSRSSLTDFIEKAGW